MEKVSSLIQKSDSIAICSRKIADEDLANSIIALTKYLQNEGKAVGIILVKEPTKEISEIFKKYDVVYTTNAAPLKYIVSIDYGKSKVEKVLHEVDEENNKVMFYIEPTGKDFDFDNVEYSQEGNSYDLTITMAIDSFQKMGKIYEVGDYLFQDNEVISLAKGINSLGDEFIPVRSTYTSAVKKIIGNTEDQEINTLLSLAVLDEFELFEGNVKPETLEEIAEFTRSGLDFSDLLIDKYYSKTYNNLDLQIKMMSNVRVDRENRVIWSIVSHDDLKFAGVNRKSLDTKGRILFNISSDFDLAISAYVVEPQLIKVVVESNDLEKYSAIEIAKRFNGKGTVRHATFVMAETPRKDFENKLFYVLKELYSLDLNHDEAGFIPPQPYKRAVEGKKVDELSDSTRYDGVVDIPQSTEIPLTEPIINVKNDGDFAKTENPVVLEAEEVAKTTVSTDDTLGDSEYADLLD